MSSLQVDKSGPMDGIEPFVREALVSITSRGGLDDLSKVVRIAANDHMLRIDYLYDSPEVGEFVTQKVITWPATGGAS
jgi:hypothetical protein